MAFPPARSISLTTDAAASAPFVYVSATAAPSAARRLAIAAPIPREPPVTSATLPSSLFDIAVPLSISRERGGARATIPQGSSSGSGRERATALRERRDEAIEPVSRAHTALDYAAYAR